MTRETRKVRRRAAGTAIAPPTRAPEGWFRAPLVHHAETRVLSEDLD
jgi:hypothetical protein